MRRVNSWHMFNAAALSMVILSCSVGANASDGNIPDFSSKGRIELDNEMLNSNDDIVFDASDFVTIGQTVNNGKILVSDALNKYPNSNIDTANTPSFAEITNVIEHLTDEQNAATDKSIMRGKVAYVNGKRIAGTYDVQPSKIVNPDFTNGSVTIQPDSGNDAVNKVILQKDTNLVASNIKSGVSIYGISGTLTDKPIIDVVNSKLDAIPGALKLCDDDSSQTIATRIAAYWPGGTPTPNITYEYHRHRTPTGGLSIDESSSTKGGCYNTSVWKIHNHTGNSISGGGCYTTTVYNKHSHVGSSNAYGGCYTRAIYKKHTHTGNSTSGGGCYGNPIYNLHQHTGNSTNGGGCYNTAVYNKHYHSGNSASGGGCYGTYNAGHTHTDSCYVDDVKTYEIDTNCAPNTLTCFDYDKNYPVKIHYKITSWNGGKSNETLSIKTYLEYLNGDETMFVEHEFHYDTPSYREGTFEITNYETGRLLKFKITNKNAASTSSFHIKMTMTQVIGKKLSCGQSESSGYYSTNCGKTVGNRYSSEGVDYYTIGCNKTAGVGYSDEGINYYDLSCGKSEGTRYNTEPVDYYELTCGKEAGVRYETEGIERYDINCGKKEGDRYESDGLDYYAPSCGKNKDTIVKATIVYD